MDKSKGRECTFEGETYSDGSQVCVAQNCMLCVNGKWEYKIKEEGCA